MASNMSEPLVQCTLRDRYSQFARRIEHAVQSTILAWQLRVYRTRCFFLCHLGFMKVVFALLRRVRPVFIFKKLLVVTKASEVREVLARFDDFTLSQSIEPGMPWGTFLMTVDWPNQHAQERQLLQDAVRRTDIQKIRAVVAARCHDQIASARGQIDVVTELLEPVVVDIAKQYYGVPPLAGSPHKMALAMRDLAGIIMVDPPVNSEPWARSRDSIADITTHVLAELSRTTSALASTIPPNDDLLTRLTQRLRTPGQPNWFDQDWIRRYLTGLLATGAATIVRAGAQAVDQLLAHPAALERARGTALELDRVEQLGMQERAEQLRCTLRHFLYEALRFRPMLPLLIRDTPRETVIAYGTKRARIVPAGTKVIAPPLAAMFDPEEFIAPSDFNPSRPLEQYVHFGHGPRQCFGKYIAETTLIEIIRSLLVLPDLSRADGPKGRVAYEGPVAAGLFVTFHNHSKS
jgi:cytochrome P450